MTRLVAGVDEAGRGPLAGPVVVAAVILDPDQQIQGLADSKKLSEKRREALYPEILRRSLAWSIVEVSVGEIDEINILQATLVGMKRAVEQLSPAPQLALVDGNRAPTVSCEVKTIIQGDSLVPAISAASILAKVSRDRLMKKMDLKYPGYGFDRHKGYPTARHLQCLKTLGPCEIHRKSFAPVRKALLQGVLGS
jgi:ribonuclease HII